MRIVMIGAGYVGLVTGTCLAEAGHTVTCVDKSAERIAALNKGIIPIHEPGLDALVQRNADAGRLIFTLSLADAMKGCEAAFIAVGTPPRPQDGVADLSHVLAAAE